MRLAPRGAAVAQTTILGFGSLLSEQSSRLTFPDLENFRLVRVPNYRRLMQHPASIFFQRFRMSDVCRCGSSSCWIAVHSRA